MGFNWIKSDLIGILESEMEIQWGHDLNGDTMGTWSRKIWSLPGHHEVNDGEDSGNYPKTAEPIWLVNYYNLS